MSLRPPVHKDLGLPALRISGNGSQSRQAGGRGHTPLVAMYCHPPSRWVLPPTALLCAWGSGTKRSESGSQGSDGRGRSMPVVIYGNLCWKHSNLK